MVLNSTTHAYIGNDATTDVGGAKIDAGGSVLVSATDDTDAFVIVGSDGQGSTLKTSETDAEADGLWLSGLLSDLRSCPAGGPGRPARRTA